MGISFTQVVVPISFSCGFWYFLWSYFGYFLMNVVASGESIERSCRIVSQGYRCVVHPVIFVRVKCFSVRILDFAGPLLYGKLDEVKACFC